MPRPLIRWRGGTDKMLVPIETLRPHPENANNGDVDEIVASVLTLGVYRPIYVSSRCNYICAGHHLYSALHVLGSPVAPATFEPYTEEEEYRLMLADNDIAARAWVDPSLKLDLLQKLMKTEHGLTGTGSTFETVSLLLDERRKVYVPGADDDDDGATGQMTTCPNCQHTFPVRIEL